MISSRIAVYSTALRTLKVVLFTGLLVSVHGSSEARLIAPCKLVLDSVETCWGSCVRSNTTQLLPQFDANWVRNQVELGTSSKPQPVPIIQVSADQGAKSESGARADPRMGNEDGLYFNKHSAPFLKLFAFFCTGVLASCFASFFFHAYRYGINNAWRDLVFDWPIPYWMRFVPKWEQEL